MIANMNEKGRQVKLLAAIAVLAMVVCAFAVVLPSDNVDAVSTPEGANPVDAVEDITAKSPAGNYMLTTDISLDKEAWVIPAGVALYTNGHTITATSTAALTAKGTVYINGVGGALVATDSAEAFVTAEAGKYIADTNAGFSVGTGNNVKTFIGTNGIYVISSGTAEITITPSGFVATLKGTVTMNSTGMGTDTIIVNENSTLTIAGTVTAAGGIGGKIVNNGTVNFTGNGNAVRSIFQDADGNASTEGVVAYSDGTLFGTLDAVATKDASGNINNTISVFGTINNNLAFTTNGSFWVGPNSTYSGDVKYVAGEITYNVGIIVNTGEDSVNVISNSAEAITITGKASTLQYGKVATDLYAVSSNVILTSLTAVDGNTTNNTVPKVNLNGVQLGNGGTFSLSVPVTLTGDAVVNSASTLSVTEGGSITTATNADLTVLGAIRNNNIADYSNAIDNANGYVYTDYASKITPYATKDANIREVGDQTLVIDNAAGFLNAIQNGLSFTLGANVLILDDLSYSNGTITTYDGTKEYAIQIGLKEGQKVADFDTSEWIIIGNAEGGSLSLSNATIASGNLGEAGITVGAKSTLVIDNTKVFATVEYGDLSTVTIRNNAVSYTNTASQVIVGYGTDFTLNGDATVDVFVYGHLTIGSDVTVGNDDTLRVFKGGELTVSSEGSITLSGNAYFMGGSTTVIDGQFNVTNRDGLANVYVGTKGTPAIGADFTISSTGTMTVNGSGSGVANHNTLTVYNSSASFVQKEGWTERFLVEGTLNVGGALVGEIHDNGTVSITGVIDDAGATVVLYDGVALNGLSVVGGDLTVTDKAVALAASGARETTDCTDGNAIVLNNVSGVSISETIGTITYKNAEDKNITGYQAVMTVSGTVTTTGTGTVTIKDNGIIAMKDDDKTEAYVNIVDDMTLGQNVTLTVNNGITLVVDGTLNAIATAAGNSDEPSKIVNNGIITVNGTMTAISYGTNGTTAWTYTENANGVTNAVMRVVSNTANGVTVLNQIYSGFSAAVDAGLDAQNKVITVMGTVNADENKTIPVGLTVELAEGANLVVGTDAEIILSDGAKMDGMTATVTVYGTFTAQDYQDDLTVQQVIADVMVTENLSRTWTSLAKALADAQSGDKIELNGPVKITEDTTIPEGVTVYTNVAPTPEYPCVVVIDDCTLTINGTLQMDTRAQGTIDVQGTDGKVVVGQTGVFSAVADAEPADMTGVAGAHFAMESGASVTYYVTNVAFAATTTANNEFVLGKEITILGSVATSDVTFAGASNALEIKLVQNGTTMSVLSAGTITLDNTVLSAGENTQFNGAVTAAGATVDMSRAYGFAVKETYDESEEVAYMFLSGTVYGTYNITAGTVTVGDGTTGTDTLTVGKDAVFNVAAGATIAIAEDGKLVSNSEDVVIDGTITTANSNAIGGTEEILVNGTMNVTKNLDLTSTLRIAGTLIVAEDNVLNINKNGILILGATPAELGETTSATLAGVIQINTSGYIIAYNGADVDAAQINWNSVLGSTQADMTTYHINDTEFATVYAFAAVDIVEVFGDNAEKIELTGWKTNYNWYPADSTTKVDAGAAIGTPEDVYAEFNPSTVRGVVTIGAGVNLYIDGVQVLGYGDNDNIGTNLTLSVGTHKVDYEIKAGWDGSSVVLTWNGQTIENGATITVSADMTTFTLSATGATNSTGISDGGSTGGDDGMGLTDYLLIVLVVLIVIMAIMVALRLMRS